MPERIRSKDGSRDTDEVLGEQGQISQQGRADGNLQRKVGTRDELKRSNERPGGATRVTKSDEEGEQP
ncbi:hypothetical protein [Tropicimonas isoalkanivorans]|uniref:Uncharacterized protein n=1 Tax=Tropicimonas isoalkanivorans TaxID=441112 RepID=A0A1I1G104_9RHOB|nr:hypothetical protein [Tropicimonas isoalkanivorans]SFC05294.1 hypothetical protein SAMN04488094_102373 [Tropicimonas isoalkanivorans]